MKTVLFWFSLVNLFVSMLDERNDVPPALSAIIFHTCGWSIFIFLLSIMIRTFVRFPGVDATSVIPYQSII